MVTVEIPFADILEEAGKISSYGWPEIASRLPPGRIPIGYFCPYVPEELLWAAGAIPIRLMDLPVKISHAQAHLPAYCCHLVKSSLENYLRGELDFLQGFVFCQSCDTMKGLADIWAIEARLPFQFNLMVPTRLNSPLAKDYFRTEVERLKTGLEERFGKIAEDKLKEAVHLFNQIRSRTRMIYERMRGEPGCLSGQELAQIVRAGNLMDRVVYFQMLGRVLEALPGRSTQRGQGIPLFLSGNIAHSGDWFSMIDQAGGCVVGDDLCSGGRTLRLFADEALDPLDALVDRYFSTFFCPTKHQGIESHQEILLKEVRETGARGVVFIFYKYCESFYFDYPDLKKSLEAAGYPTLLLEIEDPYQSKEQVKIRLQAFVEMLD